MCGVYVANHKKDVNSQQSKQTRLVTVDMAKIIEVVTALLDVDYKTIVGAIEFFLYSPRYLKGFPMSSTVLAEYLCS